jgi:hypothetical protein
VSDGPALSNALHEGEPATPGNPAPWRRLVPIAIGLGLVAWVVQRLDWPAFFGALRSTNYPGFLAFTVVFTCSLLATDTFATRAVYATRLGAVGFLELLTLRAASYLPSILNHHVGQAWLTYFLARVKGASVLQVAGSTLLVYATTFGALFLLLLAGLPFLQDRPAWVLPTVAFVAIGGLAYLVVLALRPGFLTRQRMFGALFSVSVRDQVGLVVYRMPHIAVQFLGAWIPFHFFGVEIPFGHALVLMPLLMFVVALPVSPQGLGTRDALALALFSGYAAGTPEQRAGAIAATTLSWLCALTLVQALISPFFMRRAYRLLSAESRVLSRSA